MKKEEIKALCRDIYEKDSVQPENIPALSLYIDQILTLLSGGSSEEQALTKSMVNNYSKEKLLLPVQGKKYSREQVLQLLLICRLKGVLSISEIKPITQALMEQGGGEEELQSILEHGSKQCPGAEEWMESGVERMSADGEEELLPEEGAAVVLRLAEWSTFFQMAARQVAAQCFSQRSEEEKPHKKAKAEKPENPAHKKLKKIAEAQSSEEK